jgi:outer membrane protein assembly factor BamB
MKTLLTLVLTCVSGLALAQQPEWKHWRGPNQNGSVDGGNPPIEWSLEKNVVWKSEIPGAGSSTPIVVGSQVIVLTAVAENQSSSGANAGASERSGRGSQGEDRPGGDRRGRGGLGGRRGGFGRGAAPTSKYKFIAMSFDRETGAKNWDLVLTEEVPHEGVHSTNNYAASSPVTDGRHIYVDFGSRGIFCLDMTGKQIWKQTLGRMRTRNSFGEGASAALHGNQLFVPWDHEDGSFLAALDATTGEILWKTARDELTNWGTPLVVDYQGRTQVIVNGKTVRSYDAADGKLIWECGGQTNNAVPTPMVFGQNVIAMTGFRGNAVYSISLDSEGDVSDSNNVAWHYDSAGPYVPTGTLYRDRVYLNRANSGVVAVLDAKTGEEVIAPKRLSGLSELYSSPVAANGYIYFTDRTGTTIVIKHGEELQSVAKNSLGETIDSSLAIVGDRIFVRGARHLFCLGEKK